MIFFWGVGAPFLGSAFAAGFAAGFAVSAGMTLPVSRRWLRLLVERDLIEMEAGTPLDAHTAFRLTADGHARFEAHLGGLAVKHRGLLGAA